MTTASRPVFVHVPATSRYRTDDFVLRSTDGEQTWLRREETEVLLQGRDQAGVQREFSRAFKNKQDAEVIVEQRFYNDDYYGPSDPYVFTGVRGWVPATDAEVSRSVGLERREYL